MAQKKKMFIGIIFLLLICLAVGGYQYYKAHQIFMYAGTLETTKIIVSSKVASDIVEFPVAEGDMVKKGDKLLEMSCDIYKVKAPQLNNDYERALSLIKDGFVSQADLDVLERDKRDNDLKLKWCVVESPIDGMVITTFKENGEIVNAGTALLSVANPYNIWAYFYVPHDELYRLKIGQKVTGILPEANNKKFTGKIIKINEEAEFTPKNVQTREERTRLVFGVKVQFENPDLILKAGMTIESDLF